jgi:hypothetical protein
MALGGNVASLPFPSRLTDRSSDVFRVTECVELAQQIGTLVKHFFRCLSPSMQGRYDLICSGSCQTPSCTLYSYEGTRRGKQSPLHRSLGLQRRATARSPRRPDCNLPARPGRSINNTMSWHRLHDGPLQPDQPGLIYGHCGNRGLIWLQELPPDDDGTIPARN